MPLQRHVETAAARLEDAARRIEAARAAPPTLESLRAWLDALTDYTVAAVDVQAFSAEGVEESVRDLAARLAAATPP
jgi:hypothetical protein